MTADWVLINDCLCPQSGQSLRLFTLTKTTKDSGMFDSTISTHTDVKSLNPAIFGSHWLKMVLINPLTFWNTLSFDNGIDAAISDMLLICPIGFASCTARDARCLIGILLKVPHQSDEQCAPGRRPISGGSSYKDVQHPEPPHWYRV